MPFSTTYANEILNFIFSKSSGLASPTTVFLGLSVNDPEESKGAFTELSGDTYQRIAISQNGATYPDYIGTASGREIKNTKQINWTKATKDWSAVKGFGLFSTEKSGSPFYYGKLDLTGEQIAKGGLVCEKDAVMLFEAGKLKISFPAEDTIAGEMVYAQKPLDGFVNDTALNAYMYSKTPSPFVLQFNAATPVQYIVDWDGVEYRCESKEGTLGVNSGIFIGNTKYSVTDADGVPVDSKEPFMIGYDPAGNQLVILADGDATAHTVIIYKND